MIKVINCVAVLLLAREKFAQISGESDNIVIHTSKNTCWILNC